MRINLDVRDYQEYHRKIMAQQLVLFGLSNVKRELSSALSAEKKERTKARTALVAHGRALKQLERAKARASKGKRALGPDPEALLAQKLAALIELRSAEGKPANPSREATLTAAIKLGASAAALRSIALSRLVSKSLTIALPPHRYEGLSRGKGWARKGSGDSVVWGEKAREGYLVGPGRWVVGGNDGFNRKGENHWEVEHVQVGSSIWTVAD
jgi:hypothetical protein